jgi:hypothetical protein
MSEPIDKELYNYVKKLADKKFKSKTGIYKSSWIVSEYKRRGGKYKGKKTSKKGLLRWYKEKWVDLNRPIKDNKGKIIDYEECGRKSLKEDYPLCRPTYRITKSTPKIYSEISKKSITKAKKEKAKVKGNKYIKFGGKKNYKCNICNEKYDNIKSFKEHMEIEIDCDCCMQNKIGGKSQYYGKKSKVMVPIPKDVKKWAKYAFKLRELGFEGAIETGIKRGKQLSSKEKIPIEDLRYMRNWYARHIYTSYPGFKKWIEAGRPKTKEWHNKRSIVSWIIWGGNAGFNWINSDKVIKMLNKHFDKNYKKIKIKV